ncbi:MAG: 5-(carboxyamino)imidazole ribonucleotide mutase [Clostridia bacterium]|nr:5-(carboxyamino)imidazole ribonucleotide mutase [Clostridia bacterium]
MNKKAALLMGSKSDYKALEPCIKTFAEFGVELEVRIMSAHRTPAAVTAFVGAAEANGFGVILAAAGMSAHLAGVVAAHTVLPVIAIPMKGDASIMDGLDALLSMVHMPPGIPVACVGVNAGKNAALLALQILQGYMPELGDKLRKNREEMAATVAMADEEVNNAK